ncbi:hypothetical protein BCR32DRAFT_270733 [Anaeromyces robustus]|uniref:Uncharacterized protein n=1 Tax=Anaeromyces robustus TaxID=1754192 RepID=A0A1Y1WUX5_9FUNG|nr:hypothetical protein BCR32DRAFT_270733 [Anaeromyces robustus]|eukprot:ORX77313.1 hypothetical protein BCR32DRAFT_270733 [Anaeromyces robustus]
MVNKNLKQSNGNSVCTTKSSNVQLQVNKEMKEQNKVYLQKWSIAFSLSFFFVILSIFLVVVENNSFSGYKLYAHQQYKRSISALQKSVNNFSLLIDKSNTNISRQKRSDLSNIDISNFKLIYPYQSFALASDSIQELTWDISKELNDEKMDIVLKSVTSSDEEIIIAKNVNISMKKYKWNINYTVSSGHYKLEFRLSNNGSFLGFSPEIIILSISANDKSYYPRLLKFTYPYAPMEWRINDDSLVTWNPLLFTEFSTTFKLSICELISKNNIVTISEYLIHPEVQASNGYYKVNLKKIRGVSPGKEYFFKASFVSGVLEMSSLFIVVDDNLEITNFNKEIQIISPYTPTTWKINETVNISLNIKRYIKDDIPTSYLRLAFVDMGNVIDNTENTFINQFSMSKRKNNEESYIIKIKDIKNLDDSQIIWTVPNKTKIGYYIIQLVKVDENKNESIIDQTSPIIEVIP